MMFVLMDLEWITDYKNFNYETQFAALRVDQNWKEVSSYTSLIRPQEWVEHAIGLGGHTRADYDHANSLTKVMEGFQRWLQSDDVLCWWQNDPKELFEKEYKRLMGVELDRVSIELKPCFMAFVDDGFSKSGNPYDLAAARNIPRYKPAHDSLNDVLMLSHLLAAVSLTQDMNELLHADAALKVQDQLAHKNAKYLIDTKDNSTHFSGCKRISSMVNCSAACSIREVLKYHGSICSCCRDKVLPEIVEYNAKELASRKCSGYSKIYFYLDDSAVFHTRDCYCLLRTTKRISSTPILEKLSGQKTPCRHCRPDVDREIKDISFVEAMTELSQPARKIVAKPKVGIVGDTIYPVLNMDGLNKAHRRAYQRYLEVKEQRKNSPDGSCVRSSTTLLADDSTGLFHTLNCDRIGDHVNMRGFSHCTDAKRKGYRPCKYCNPTHDDEATFSIPEYSAMYKTESLLLIRRECDKYGIRFEIHEQEQDLVLYTDMGEWIVDLVNRPIVLMHLNTVNTYLMGEKNYHEQPVMFMNVIDAIRYVNKHDNKGKSSTPVKTTESKKIELGIQMRDAFVDSVTKSRPLGRGNKNKKKQCKSDKQKKNGGANRIRTKTKYSDFDLDDYYGYEQTAY